MTLYPYHATETSWEGGDIATLDADAIDPTDTIDTRATDECDYPESDGLPMADNTKQFRMIAMIKENIEIMYMHNPPATRPARHLHAQWRTIYDPRRTQGASRGRTPACRQCRATSRDRTPACPQRATCQYRIPASRTTGSYIARTRH